MNQRSKTTMWPEVLPRAGNRRLERLASLSPWFEIYKVSEGVFAVLEPSHTEEAISYLILGSKCSVLLDTGMGIADLRVEIERLTDLPVVVVNSHGHYDHIGDNHRFSEVRAFDADTDVARIEQGMMFAHFEDSDFAVYQKSIQYLVDLLPRVNHLCPSHNEAYVDKTALVRVQETFEQIVADAAPFEIKGNARVYRFDGFGLMVPA